MRHDKTQKAFAWARPHLFVRICGCWAPGSAVCEPDTQKARKNDLIYGIYITEVSKAYQRKKFSTNRRQSMQTNQANISARILATSDHSCANRNKPLSGIYKASITAQWHWCVLTSTGPHCANCTHACSLHTVLFLFKRSVAVTSAANGQWSVRHSTNSAAGKKLRSAQNFIDGIIRLSRGRAQNCLKSCSIVT